ncbi:hypothetical protein GCM10023322_33220 [Rugosimonospora acidiphila]|uniref:Uncharacterized protein n=1 Tax=Rugosimonospora acidiphila TaxID=556531 RepID=A0ABP9RV65_9ACTN
MPESNNRREGPVPAVTIAATALAKTGGAGESGRLALGMSGGSDRWVQAAAVTRVARAVAATIRARLVDRRDQADIDGTSPFFFCDAERYQRASRLKSVGPRAGIRHRYGVQVEPAHRPAAGRTQEYSDAVAGKLDTLCG